jgi:hypothetical protein
MAISLVRQQEAAAQIVGDALASMPGPTSEVPEGLSDACKTAQSALTAAETAAYNALDSAAVMNRVVKLAAGSKVQGAYGDAAQDNLRSALLFAGAGLDRSLKRLVERALPALVKTDDRANEKFRLWATSAVTHSESGGVDPARLLELLLGTGLDPQAVLVNNYIKMLTASSAQSVERVDEIASALGITDRLVRARSNPSSKNLALRDAFHDRNLIAHELDLTETPAPGTPFARKRRSRTVTQMRAHVEECLAVTQSIIADVSART